MLSILTNLQAKGHGEAINCHVWQRPFGPIGYIYCAHFRVSYICRNGAKSHRVCGENTACIQLVNISYGATRRMRVDWHSRAPKNTQDTHTGKLVERKGARKK